MALIRCYECNGMVSDFASACPHCGYPISKAPPASKNKQGKFMRLPNGFGRITKITNQKLRNPYRVMVTKGVDNKGRPKAVILKPKGYFATYNEAYAALVEYNKNPYDLDNDITVLELYNKWSEEYFEKITISSKRTVVAAWNYCSELYDMRAKDLRARHIKYVMENGTATIKGEIRSPSADIKARIKSVFNLMLDYALEYELVDKNYSRSFNISDDIIKEKSESCKSHIDFTDEEMQKLWDNVDKYDYIDVILIQSYTGLRPQELGLIETKNVNISEWVMVGGIKTAAGTNRTIPIHTKIRPFIEKRYADAITSGSKYLITCTDGKSHKANIKLTYDKYRHRFNKIIEELGLNPEHRPHDPRKQFVTKAKKAGVDDNAIKLIVGHAISDITEKIYTNRDIDWLKKDIEKIK